MFGTINNHTKNWCDCTASVHPPISIFVLFAGLINMTIAHYIRVVRAMKCCANWSKLFMETTGGSYLSNYFQDGTEQVHDEPLPLYVALCVTDSPSISHCTSGINMRLIICDIHLSNNCGTAGDNVAALQCLRLRRSMKVRNSSPVIAKIGTAVMWGRNWHKDLFITVILPWTSYLWATWRGEIGRNLKIWIGSNHARMRKKQNCTH